MTQENKEILDILAKFLEENPEQRFGQALVNLSILEMSDLGRCYDPWHKSNKEILENAKKSYENMKNNKI